MPKTDAIHVIEELARLRGLFRERDLKEWGVSHTRLHDALVYGLVKPHGHGVWSHPRYAPTRYEILQIRVPRAVFWGPSALWLLGAEAQEPEALWIAIANKSRPPTTLDQTTVIIRTRCLERAVVSLCPQGRFLTLRVHARERAQEDIARTDINRRLTRAADRIRFALPYDGGFLSSGLPSYPRWPAIPEVAAP